MNSLADCKVTRVSEGIVSSSDMKTKLVYVLLQMFSKRSRSQNLLQQYFGYCGH